MAEGNHVSETPLFELLRGAGRGYRIWAGKVEVSNDETIDTGLDEIDAVAIGKIGLEDEFATVKSVSGGEITFGTGKLTAPGTPVSDVACYVIAIGKVY